MNNIQIQEMFKAWDAFDIARLGTFWHDDIVMNLMGIRDREEPVRIRGKKAALESVESVKEQLQQSGWTMQHIPDWIIIEEDLVAVQGISRVAAPNSADVYGSFMDFFKLKDDKIIEYYSFSYNYR